MVDRIGAEVAADVVDERLRAHRPTVRRGLDGRERDAPSEAAAPPLLGRPSLGIRPGDLERPAFVADRHRGATVADLLGLAAVALDAGHDLARHRVVDAAQLDQFGPRPPRVGEHGSVG